MWWYDFHGVKNLSLGSKHTPVVDLVAKIEHFIGFVFKYGNLC